MKARKSVSSLVHINPFNPIMYLILASLVVLTVTMIPSSTNTGEQLGRVNLIPFSKFSKVARIIIQHDQPLAQVRGAFVDVIGNIALFVPFGALVNMTLAQKTHPIRLRIFPVFCAGLLFSTLIETLQFWLPTRYADVDDVIFNSIGAMVGAMLALALYIGRKYLSHKWQPVSAPLRVGRLAEAPVEARHQ